jgi:hypothetical protein
MTTTPTTSLTPAAIFGAAPGPTPKARLQQAFLRALRTLLQGVAGAFPTAGAGMAVLETGYWTAFGYACVAALIAALVSFLQNIADFLPSGSA